MFDVLLISVRTEETRLINRAFTLASSRCPKPGSAAPAVQPTVMLSAPSSSKSASNGDGLELAVARSIRSV